MDTTTPALPFVKKFKTSRYNYLYDVNSNAILRLDDISFALVEELGRNNDAGVVAKFCHLYQETDIRQRWESLTHLQQENRYLSCHRPTIFSGFQTVADIQETYAEPLAQIIFELTERCSQRCKYCSFSGTYSYNRTHGQQDMPVDIALKALEFFVQHTSPESPNLRTPAITFYGGDPLLNFDLLKEIIERAKARVHPHSYTYSFTTNLTHLEDETLFFLVENGIRLLISLDGPKHIHDRYRVFQNGTGTFATVMANLNRIKAYSSEYFMNCLSFASVLAPPYDFDTIIEFFYQQEFFTPFHDRIKIGFVDPIDTTFFVRYHLEAEQEKQSEYLNRLRARYEKALVAGTYQELTLEKQLFLKPYFHIVARPLQPLGQYVASQGMCFPGLRRLFVDIKGDFYMCEKVGSNYPIGNVERGFDYPRILQFYRQYDAFFLECRQCWALRLCNHCFNEIKKGANFDREKLLPLCQRKRKNLEDTLLSYCRILEEKPDAFQFMESIQFV